MIYEYISFKCFSSAKYLTLISHRRIRNPLHLTNTKWTCNYVPETTIAVNIAPLS